MHVIKRFFKVVRGRLKVVYFFTMILLPHFTSAQSEGNEFAKNEISDRLFYQLQRLNESVSSCHLQLGLGTLDETEEGLLDFLSRMRQTTQEAETFADLVYSSCLELEKYGLNAHVIKSYAPDIEQEFSKAHIALIAAEEIVKKTSYASISKSDEDRLGYLSRTFHQAIERGVVKNKEMVETIKQSNKEG